MGDCSTAEADLPPEINNFLRNQLKGLDFAFTISDPTKADCPISFASQRFYELTGYTPDEVIGHNCRFLQGPDTERRKVSRGARSCRRGFRGCLAGRACACLYLACQPTAGGTQKQPHCPLCRGAPWNTPVTARAPSMPAPSRPLITPAR